MTGKITSQSLGGGVAACGKATDFSGLTMQTLKQTNGETTTDNYTLIEAARRYGGRLYPR